MATTERAAATRQEYDHSSIEMKWRDRWETDELYRTHDDDERPKWYSLTMYPYPSGTLHVGHWYAFAVPDVFARFQRMKGYNVLFPMGFDAFGLPAENAAIRHNIHPAIWTYENIDQMRGQYRQMGAMIDWSRQVITSDPDYYRWNQWIFLKMLERGLAYRSPGAVWWCPVDNTVLANEQVLEGNICERCGATVERRDLEQWYFRITKYADELLRELDSLDWPERVKTMQRNWIGRSEGARLEFRLETGDTLDVFTTRPDTVWGATFMVLAPEHPIVTKITTPDRLEGVMKYVEMARNQSEIDRMSTDEARPKTGVFTGAYAINPVNDERIPLWVADYVLMGYGTGAIMAVPAHDERDFAFAKAFDLPVRVVIQAEDHSGDTGALEQPYVGPGVMVNSGVFDGTKVPESVPEVIGWLSKEGRGRAEVNYRLRDWLISRQRYWGTPFPIVYCESCGIVPVREKDLPVQLPTDAEFKPTGQSPLQSHQQFLHVECPSCGGRARRETDTMDTFVDSSWYWFRYTSPHDETMPFDPNRVERWCPVDLYCGGIEHAILHLLYARFFTKVLRDLGMIEEDEPFLRLRNQGMILAEEGTKMSKSRGTQIAPDELVKLHGADALRLHLMYLGPWDQGGPWNTRGITGMERFIRRAYSLVAATVAQNGEQSPIDPSLERQLEQLTHRTIKRVTQDLEDFQFNTMVAGLIEMTNALMDLKENESAVQSAAWRRAIETLVLLMAPSTPHVAEEMWQMLGRPYSVHLQTWPAYDEELTIEDQVEIVVQVNGKVRDRLQVQAGVSEEQATAMALQSPKVLPHLGDREADRIIHVPAKLINIVVRG